MAQQRHREDVYVGARYRRRHASNIVWEVYTLLEDKGEIPHVALFNVADPTSRKTLSEFTLAQSGQYQRLPDS